MTYLTMPYYVKPMVGWYLSPKPTAAKLSTSIRGLLLILAINAAWALVFYLLTDKLSTSP